jgi:hypothetical protein
MPVTPTQTARAAATEVAPSLPTGPGLDRRYDDPRDTVRPSQARHQGGPRPFVDPTVCERDYAAAEREFKQAMDEYKRRSGRMFPTWSEVLEVLRSLGYEKTTGDGEPRSVRTVPAGMGPIPHVNPEQFGGENRDHQNRAGR